MNPRIKQVALAVGTLALGTMFLVPVLRHHAQAATAAPVPAALYTDTTLTNAAPPVAAPGSNYATQNYWNFIYGMMGWMMRPYWNYQGNGTYSAPGYYPYHGMMGGYWGYPGPKGGPYPAPPSPGSVSGSVY